MHYSSIFFLSTTDPTQVSYLNLGELKSVYQSHNHLP